LGFFFTQAEKNALYTEKFADTISTLRGQPSYTEYWKDASHAGQQAMLWTDLSTYLTDDILVKVDRMSMANSLEVRSPLLDHKVVEFMAQVQRKHKYTYRESKILLRRLAERYVPAAILDRPKQGFAIPLAAWLQNELRPWLEEILLSPQAVERGFFSEVALRKMVADHLARRRDYSQQLWALLMLEVFLGQCESR
jgi:asparagine synthase (glutamine-hydrolysing)